MNSAASPGAAQITATVAATLGAQTLTALAMAVPAVLAPVAAADLGIDPTRVGLWAGFAFFFAMFGGLLCGTLVGRYGPVRMLQVAAVFVGCGLVAGAGANAVLVLVSAIFLGAAHGLVTPASSGILALAAPPRMRSMIFSIKQTGVPLGGAIAGLLLPALLLVMGWRPAVLVLGLFALLCLATLVPMRALYDHGRRPGQPLRVSRVAAPIAEVWRNRPILALALASASYSAVQTSFITYIVSYLKLELGYTLVAAGFAFSAAQVAGVLGRIAWGVVADRYLQPRLVLILLGITMGLCGMGVIFFDQDWPYPAIVAVCMLYGATAVAWNGVYLAEVARLAPEGRVAMITGGTQFFTFIGALVGAPLFGATASATGSYGSGFIVFAVLPVLTAVGLMAPANRPTERRA